MRWSRYFLNTLRETPADADAVSHRLMMRAGMIQKVAAGIYTYLPLGLRAVQKLETIVREEMNKIADEQRRAQAVDNVRRRTEPSAGPRDFADRRR